ncbi:MAG: glycerophosphoryl diester phosphodiesterase [Frankiales bacterium]|nr:glycerophosphoryl diester phosphodiesterase [Frankiales bacterium]
MAYKQAIDDGADAVECDIRLTRDGVLICVHDRRVDRTSDGRGVVSTLELADLHDLDFGSWRSQDLLDDPITMADWEAPDRDRSGVLTLERLLDYVLASTKPVRLAIETKHPTRYAGLVERALVDLLQRFELDRQRADGRWPVRVMSFAQTSLRRIHQGTPGLPTVLLFRRMPLRFRDGSLPPRVFAAGPAIEIVRAHPSYVQRVHDRGHEVHVWTVDELADVDLCLELGVDAIITNRPRQVMRHLGQGAPPALPPAG